MGQQHRKYLMASCLVIVTASVIGIVLLSMRESQSTSSRAPVSNNKLSGRIRLIAQDVDSRTVFDECKVFIERTVDDVVFTDRQGDVLVPSIRTTPRTPGTPAPENVTGIFATDRFAVARCIAPDRSIFYWLVTNDYKKPVRAGTDAELQNCLESIGASGRLQFVSPREYVASR